MRTLATVGITVVATLAAFGLGAAAVVGSGAAAAENPTLGGEHSRIAERDRTRFDPLRRAAGDSAGASLAGGLELR